MARHLFSPAHRAPSGRLRARVFVVPLSLSLFLMAHASRGEVLGTHPHRNGIVHLMTDLCDESVPGAGQRARQTVGARERLGCWGIDRAGNPVVTWSDGSELILAGDKLKLSPKMAWLMEERAKVRPPPPPARPLPTYPTVARDEASKPPARANGQARADNAPQVKAAPAEAPRAAAAPPSRSAAAPPAFARPAWCPHAGFPHERLVCSDPELAERDLHLASLWRPYRRALSRADEAWHKGDYFRRLKACGADKSCVVDEQERQLRRYREPPPGNG